MKMVLNPSKSRGLEIKINRMNKVETYTSKGNCLIRMVELRDGTLAESIKTTLKKMVM